MRQFSGSDPAHASAVTASGGTGRIQSHLCLERLPARCDDMHQRVGAQQCLGHHGRGIDHMRAIVEHDQQLLSAQRTGHTIG
jgi:hypothetical protein